MGIFDTNPFQQETKEEKNVFIDLLQTVVIALSICVVIYLFIATPNEVNGQSMEPNFHDGELLLTNKIMHLLGNTGLSGIVGDYKRGDVVIFRPTFSDEDFIKRIVALEGDTFMLQDGEVFVDGVKLDEEYIPEGRRTEGKNFILEGEPIVVPEDSFIVLGDNREDSTDSRSVLVQFARRDQLKGRVFFRYWPLDTFGIIKRENYPELESSVLPLTYSFKDFG
jgi:signal peptidase I